MRVLHRHLNIGVPGQFLDFRQRSTAANQFRDMRVPAGSMEVRNARVVSIRNANLLQVVLHHVRRVLTGEIREKLVARGKSDEPLSQFGNKFRVQRQDILSPVLGMTCFHRDGRAVSVQIKTLRRQAGQFAFPKAGHIGQEVDSRPLLPRNATDLLFAAAGRCNQLADFIGGQGPPLPANIDFRIQPLQPKQGVGQNPLCHDAPVAERIHCLDIVVIRPRRNVLRSSAATAGTPGPVRTEYRPASQSRNHRRCN